MRMTLLAALALALAGPAAAQAPAPAGGEFRLNIETSGDQSAASAAADAAGRFVVVWHGEGVDGDGFGIVGQRLDASGARLGSEFMVNQHTTGQQEVPSVAALPDGRFLVAWAQADPANGPWSVRARSFRAGGLAAGPEVAVSTFTSSIGRPQPHVAAIPGGFVVVWSATDQGDTSRGYGRVFNAESGPLGAEFRMGAQSGSEQAFPAAAGLPNGAFVLAWSDLSDFTEHVWVRLYDTGGPQGPETQVDTHVVGQNREFRQNVAIATQSDGAFTISWSDIGCWFGKDPICTFDGVSARHYDTAGTPVGDEFRVGAPSAKTLQPSLAFGERRAALTAWTSTGGPPFCIPLHCAPAEFQDGSGASVYARRLGPELVSSEFRVNTYTTDSQYRPAVASDPAGNVLVVWQSSGQDGSSFGVYGQRYGGLRPAAMDVDTAGNHVWEPGEGVDLRPAWRNVNGAAVAFSGTLSGLTGPGSATYTITDGSGNYGTVANGASAACSDCYGVAVTAPANRPFTHWDGTVVETLAPDTQGQQIHWPLHIGSSFTDVPASNPFYRFVETLLHRGVTAGCTADTYCPAVATTREQMAVFVLVAKEGAGYAPAACVPPNVFTDVPETSPFCRYIEELASRGVVGGCAPSQYCGSSPVTREQMAVFVLRTLDPTLVPPACVPPNIFNDMPETSPFCRWVEELANRGIVAGCAAGQYCGSAPVTREQMGVFLGATFGLTLYGL